MGKQVAHPTLDLGDSLLKQMLLEPRYLRGGGMFAVFASESVCGVLDNEQLTGDFVLFEFRKDVLAVIKRDQFVFVAMNEQCGRGNLIHRRREAPGGFSN